MYDIWWHSQRWERALKRGTQLKSKNLTYATLCSILATAECWALVNWSHFILGLFFCVSVCIFSWLLSGHQYQYNWLSGKTRLWNDLSFVEWDVKLYSITHALFATFQGCLVWLAILKIFLIVCREYTMFLKF